VAIAPNPAVSHALAEVPFGLPCVGVGAADSVVPTVRIDNTAGAALATRHLLDLGHRTVHHVAGPADWPEAAERVEGWRGTLYAAGAIVPPVLPQEWSARSGYERGRILARDPDVTAIFCANDQIALGVLRALHEAGRRVPDDVSVVGFDDMPDSGYFLPPLTTVRQDFSELGRRGIEVLLAQIAAGHQQPGQVVLAPELILRESTAAPPRSR
jgi:DNA-binding LacI/PurR family transcriptional regulator